VNPAPQLDLDSIRFQYPEGAWNLHVPHLSLGGDRLCGIVGPNGSGKSSLLRLAAGLAAPDQGQVRLNGRSVLRLSRKPLARQVGYLPQECPALFDYTVAQVVAMGRHAHGGLLEPKAPDDIGAVARALDAVRMEPLRHRRLSQLSGGERRRAWLASALAQEPDLLLLDEPTQALDLHHAASVMAVLSRKAAEGLRVVTVLHDLNLAGLYCTRLVLLKDGRVVADGRPDEILTQERLVEAYGPNLDVVHHPKTLQPIVLPRHEN